VLRNAAAGRKYAARLPGGFLSPGVPGLIGSAFCEAWEEVYASLSAMDFNRPLQLLETFLRTCPDDGVARYHAQNLRQRLSERTVSSRAQ
jgi:hypothetical protein